MKLGILITTYQKLDGSTPDVLMRAINSIKNQTYQDYTLIVMIFVSSPLELTFQFSMGLQVKTLLFFQID